MPGLGAADAAGHAGPGGSREDLHAQDLNPPGVSRRDDTTAALQALAAAVEKLGDKLDLLLVESEFGTPHGRTILAGQSRQRRA
jgi:hypothetical protein